MRCSAPGWVKTFQTSVVNAPGPPRAARGWARPLMPCRTRMPALRAAAARASTGVPVSAAMSLRLRWRSGIARGASAGRRRVPGRGRAAEPGAGEELPDGALAASGDAGDLAGAVSLLVRSRSCSVPGGSGSAGGGPGSGRELRRRVACGDQPDVVGGGAEPGGDGADGQARAHERVQVSGADVAGVGSGPGDAGDPAEGRFPADWFVDSGVVQQEAGPVVQEAGERLGQGEDELGVVLAVASGQPQRPGQVAGVGAGEQLDQAEPGEVFLDRGGGQVSVAGVAAVRPGVWWVRKWRLRRQPRGSSLACDRLRSRRRRA